MGVCAFIVINYTQPIGGHGHTVELSEYSLQKKEESYDVWMIIGIDRNSGANFVVHVEKLNTETIWPILKNYILPGSEIVTKRHIEFTKMEEEAENPSLTFVHTARKPRTEDDYHFDAMWSALVEYVKREIPPNSTVLYKELYAYQFLYFNRDGFCDKPASELILPFISDVKQVYPGFEKDIFRGFKKLKRKL